MHRGGDSNTASSSADGGVGTDSETLDESFKKNFVGGMTALPSQQGALPRSSVL